MIPTLTEEQKQQIKQNSLTELPEKFATELEDYFLDQIITSLKIFYRKHLEDESQKHGLIYQNNGEVFTIIGVTDDNSNTLINKFSDFEILSATSLRIVSKKITGEKFLKYSNEELKKLIQGHPIMGLQSKFCFVYTAQLLNIPVDVVAKAPITRQALFFGL